MNAGELEQPKKMSKKARKLASRLTVAELKQLVRRPDVVEVEDVTSADPRLLVYLKSYRNTVPVPRHWCSKRHTFKVVEEQKRLLSNCLVEVKKCVNDRLYCEYRHFRYSCFNR